MCDYQLATGENGLDTIASVRAALGDDVPAILITADTTPAVSEAAKHAGTPVLHKPVSPLKLRALLDRLLHAPGAGGPR